MKEFLKDWKVHALCGVMVLAAEFIGKHAFAFGLVSFTMFPMLYTIIMGILLAVFKLIPREMMETASPYITISVLMLGARSAATIGPNLGLIFSSGAALVLQEFGNLGTIFFALPVGILILGMGRSVVGAGFSISREGSLIVIGDMYGLDSDEGLGVMGGYITGTLFGTILCGLMASALANTGWFHPYALAMACGTGSASMMSAQVAPLMDIWPEMKEQIYALAYASNTLSGIDGLYMNLLLAIPISNGLYKLLWKLKGKTPPVSSHHKDANIDIKEDIVEF
ncbi:MAG: DUF3100 domain-containing protein [Clostridiaceae bacterium]|nr:DUF3100 domain-containing protein [Clostridiaceae bacterium]